MTSQGCPSEDELVRMVEGALGNESLMSIESHVDTCEHCAAVIANLGALGSPSTRARVVGRYQLDRRIGGGGMGEVWAAWDPQLRRDIAVKLVKPERSDDTRERERLKREARALARLTHPNVLAVYDVGETTDEVFIATELVIGDTLASRGGANADWRALVKLYAQAARGLAAAHHAGLVHRDIKPANLLIGTDGRVRVADFGLAVKSATPSPLAATGLAATDFAGTELAATGLAATDFAGTELAATGLAATELAATGLAATGLAGREHYTMQITQTGHIAGTPAYMAPEQRLGEPADARADQYALCIALAESVAGRRPPLDIGHEAMIAFVAERRPREADLDRLCGVIARGLAIDRDDRYPDMDRLADDLDACLAPSIGPTDHVQPLRAARPSRRTITTIAIAGGAALAAIAAVLVVWRLMSHEDRAIAATSAAPAPLAAPGVTQSTQPPTPSTQPATQSTQPPTQSTQSTDQRPQVALLPPDAAPAPPPTAPSAPPTTPSATSRPRPTPPVSAASRTSTITPDVQQQVDLGLAAARRAMQKRDGTTCLAAVNALPVDVPVMVANNIEFHRAQCEMLRGECERGIERMNAAQHALGSPPSGELTAIAMCPVTGPYDVRFKRLLAQAYAATGSTACKRYVTPAKTLAREASAANEKILLGGVLRYLAKCIGNDGDCSTAEALWKSARELDATEYRWDVDKCTAPATLAAVAARPTMTVQAFNDALAGAQQSIVRRDTRACRDLVAMPAGDIPHGMQNSWNLIAGFCKMMLGDCKAGSELVTKVYPGDASVLASNQDIYCPIAGTLDQRLARMRMQLLTFADKRLGAPRSEWCSYMMGPAKIAAREARSDAQRTNAAKVLQHIAWCISVSGRCDEAHDLWSLSGATDASAPASTALSANCP